MEEGRGGLDHAAAVTELYRNKVSIGDEEIYCNRLGAVILFQCRTNTLRLKWRQGFVGRAVDCPLCGAVEETVAHCHQVRCAGGGEGAVWSNPPPGRKCWRRYCSSEGGHRRRWREALHCWRRRGEGKEEKWTNKCRDLHISSVGTLGADRKALPPKNIIIDS